MAREEYDKEVALRRDAERQMDSLRHKFLDQAKRLAQVDQEQRTAENLKRQSKDLRNSVVGIQKHLSELKTEVALSTAQVAELAALGKDECVEPFISHPLPTILTPFFYSPKTSDHSSGVSAVHDNVAEALDARLEAIKDVHRDEVNALIAQRDDLLREVSELKEARDSFLEEAGRLASENAALNEKNVDASRQLDQVHESLSKLQVMTSKSGIPSANDRIGHHHSPSSSSLGSSLTAVSSVNTGRSPLATARVIGSPSEMNDSFRFVKPEAVEVHSRNKFKWGKSSSSSKSGATADATKANQQLPPVPAGARSPVPPRTGSLDNGQGQGVRQHGFQQTSILRPVRCDYCGDKMWGLNEVRCTGSSLSFVSSLPLFDTDQLLPPSFPPQPADPTHTPSAPATSPTAVIPAVTTTLHPTTRSTSRRAVLRCSAEISSLRQRRRVGTFRSSCRSVSTLSRLTVRLSSSLFSSCRETDGPDARAGTTYEGIYRKTGGMGQTKLITQYFERGLDFDLQDRDKFNDLAAITSCMKNYFRTLPIPLFTHDLHEEFVSAAGSSFFSSFLSSPNLTISFSQKRPKDKVVSKPSKRHSTSFRPSISTPLVCSFFTSTSSSDISSLPPAHTDY